MLISIAQLLDDKALEMLRASVKGLVWKDGATTAGKTARAVKRNQQADLSTRAGAKLRTGLETAIMGHPVLVAAAQPRRLIRLLISKTQDHGGYGMHIDNPFMASGGESYRTDLSFTLFLSDPEDYEGGELVVEQAGLTQTLKPDAGDLVLYPSTSLHEVAPVTAGERLVCVGWIESRVRNGADREILFDLENLRAELSASHSAQSPEMLTLSKAIANLKRRFS